MERQRSLDGTKKKKKVVLMGGGRGHGQALEPSEVERISMDERSSYSSLSSGILPSLGARSNRKTKLRPFIISPFDARYRSPPLYM